MTPGPIDLLPDAARRRIARAPQPDWIQPMLATLTEKRFSSRDWIFERKLDGERALVFGKGRDVKLRTRNKAILNSQYPELVEVFRMQETKSFIVDGEIVAFDGARTSFARLQRRMHVTTPSARLRAEVPVVFYAFDIVYLDGYDISALGARNRKGVLRTAIAFQSPLRFTPHRNTDGEAYWEDACRKGWEGVIAKRAEAPYVGKRSGDWLKFKCTNQQEFVVGGYTEPKGTRRHFGALLIGYYEGDELVFAGKVGTGFDAALLEQIGRRLESLERSDPPFDRGRLPRKDVHWVHPRLVAQIGFSEWTGDGQLRHPRFLGLRTDKRPAEVVREGPGG